MFLYQLKNFCKYTKIPGYKYIVLPNRTRQERHISPGYKTILLVFGRIFWIITLIITTISGCIVSYAVVSDDPTKTEIVTDSTHHAVWNYIFPAVTICNINKISKRKAYYAAKKLKFSNKTVDDIADDLRVLSQLIFYNDNSSTTQQKLNDVRDLLEKNDLIPWKVLFDLSPKCSEFVTFCQWKGEVQPCEALFQEIVTSDGVCCAFNYLAPKHLINNRTKNIPERLSTCGRFTGLGVYLKSDTEDYFATTIPSSGFTMKIHYTYNLVETNSKQPFNLRDKTGNFVYLTPSVVQVSEYVRQMKISQRNCILSNERELELARQYTLRNCLFECKVKLIFKLCNCIPFYYYIEALHKGKRICEISDTNCLINNRAIFLRNDVRTEDMLFSSINSEKYCGCLKSCESHIYTTTISKAMYDGGVGPPEHSTKVFLSYTDVVGYKGTLVAKTTWGGVLAYLGGLFGLFMGLTLVTITECIYFFSVDFIIYICKKYNTRRVRVITK